MTAGTADGRIDRPLRVLILDHTARLGGAELALERLCASLDREIVDPRVLLFEDGPLRQRLQDVGVPVGIEPLSERLGDLDRHRAGQLAQWPAAVARLLSFAARLANRVRRLRPDVIYTTSLKADLIGAVVAILTRRPLVWHIHDRVSPDYLPTSMVRLVRMFARVPAHVVVNSQATARTLPGVPVVVAYPGYAPEQVSAEPRQRPGRAVIGMIGRISPTKGQMEFVKAASYVLRDHPDAEIRIIGGAMFGADDYAARVRQEVERLQMSNRVTWFDFTDDIRAHLDDLDVFVHASPVPEPFGQVVVEAMIRGVPVVATRAGGVPEILDDDGRRLGVLVEPGDVRGLAQGIAAVLANPEEAATRAARAWRSARERFSIGQTAATVTEVWRYAAHGR